MSLEGKMSPLCFSSLSCLRWRGRGGREGVGEVRGGMDGDNMKVMERDRGEGGMRHTHTHTHTQSWGGERWG